MDRHTVVVSKIVAPGHRQRWSACLVLLCLALGAGCGGAGEQKLPAIAKDARILAFGDSLTFGTGARDGEDYPAQLQRRIGRTVVRSGVPGEITAAGLLRLPGELERHRPALLLLLHGGNDFLRKLPRDQTKQNLRKMIALAQQRSIPVVLIGVPRLTLTFSAEAAELYGELAAELKLPYEPAALPELLYDRRYKSDTVHLNAAGYARFAEALSRLLQEAGALSLLALSKLNS